MPNAYLTHIFHKELIYKTYKELNRKQEDLNTLSSYPMASKDKEVLMIMQYRHKHTSMVKIKYKRRKNTE